MQPLFAPLFYSRRWHRSSCCVVSTHTVYAAVCCYRRSSVVSLCSRGEGLAVRALIICIYPRAQMHRRKKETVTVLVHVASPQTQARLHSRVAWCTNILIHSPDCQSPRRLFSERSCLLKFQDSRVATLTGRRIVARRISAAVIRDNNGIWSGVKQEGASLQAVALSVCVFRPGVCRDEGTVSWVFFASFSRTGPL